MRSFKRTEPVYSPTLLHDAAQAGDVDAVEQALATGANPNAKTLFALTPLHIAARLYGLKRSQDRPAQRWATIVDLLLDAGADPTAKDFQGSIPAKWCEGFQPPSLRARMITLAEGGRWTSELSGAPRFAGRAWTSGVRVGIKVSLDPYGVDGGVSRKSSEELADGDEEINGEACADISLEAASLASESYEDSPLTGFALQLEKERGRGWDN